MSNSSMWRPAVLPGLLVGILILCCPPASGDDRPSWQRDVERVTSQAEYTHSHWGLLVCDEGTGEVLLEHNADKLFAPASVTKLFSVAAAWDLLGPDNRFVTPVFRRGTLTDSGRLDGDLILRSSGDLTLGGRTNVRGEISFRDHDHIYANGSQKSQLTSEDPLAGLNALASQVAAAGIRQIAGEILIDGRLFAPAASTGSGPERVSAVMVNDNLLDVLITPAKVGHAATVSWRPRSSLVEVDASVETSEADARAMIQVGWVGSGRVVVRGTIPADREPLLRVLEWPDAELMARGLFIEALRRAGIEVAASPLRAPEQGQLPEREWYESAERVAALTSPAFSEHAKLILKVSHNLHASALPLLIATSRERRSLAEGLHLQGDVLAKMGVDRDTISLGGGAGGDRADYVTPRATVQLLRAMAARSDFDRFQTCLPILGVDGTLATVVDSDSPARGKVFAKTGTLYWNNPLNDRTLLTSKALAGYIEAASGRRLTFAIFVNLAHLPSPEDTVREGRSLGRIAEILQQAL